MEEFKEVADNLILMTDDGSYGRHGLVTQPLQELLESALNMTKSSPSIPMMKFVCKTTQPFGTKTMVSLNPIMVDGTGMCGGCRVTVGGETKFACVDDPVRRSSGGFRRADEPQQRLPRSGSRSHREARLPH